MSLPGEGVHRVYRNSISSVSRFLNTRHANKYKILNLSGIPYDYSKFNNQVEDYKWQDHYPPEIDILFRACLSMDQWLSQDPENIIVTNCRAGKGRTGTLICCYMIFCGRFSDYTEAANYYKIKRFSQGGGVTQPSQLRYIQYFAQVMQENIKYPLLVNVERVLMRTAPHCSGSSSKLVFSVFESDKLIFTNQAKDRDRQISFHDTWSDNTVHEIVMIKEKRVMQGDINCTLVNWGLLNMKMICRFSFNTAFITQNNELAFKKYELDPDNFKNSRKVSENFEIFVQFQRSCPCSPQLELMDRCAFCQTYLKRSEKMKWDEIHTIIGMRSRMEPKVLLFGLGEEDDIERVLNNVPGTGDDGISSDESDA
jgi:phosphatidylinositol-3,4,5-trisphosphate 3-phosphatase/dual-specificity protein phosphatase PTEN